MVRWPGWPWERARNERKVVERSDFKGGEEGDDEHSLLPL